MLCWSKNKPTNVGRYWCWLNNQSIIVRIWKSTIDGKLITTGGTSIKDHYYSYKKFKCKKLFFLQLNIIELYNLEITSTGNVKSI